MNLIFTLVVLALVVTGIAGIVVRKRGLRILCWVLSLPALACGGLALSQGGIVEPFSHEQMLTFCALAFTPAIGSIIGQVVISGQRRKERQNNPTDAIATIETSSRR
jgi:hypothetical protein